MNKRRGLIEKLLKITLNELPIFGTFSCGLANRFRESVNEVGFRSCKEAGFSMAEVAWTKAFTFSFIFCDVF
jgi:hypothetical protein